MIVLDASVALSWCFEDQSSDATVAVLERVHRHGALVPSHWALEVASALLLAVRRGRLPDEKRRDFDRMLERANVQMDVLTHARAGRETFELAMRNDLSSYDAAYLELARRKGVLLATRDRRLAEAARAEGLKTIEP